ncbi:hypothetical protein OH76DRAFT_430787 [Lentinus brumalis]|uniref:Uncharacterized protein n=1 Tax=Lentinus brumalis TaxID=2498619 RepID=A0A371DDM5_9APHY|nr:hypothetical protein OH76DRAFT_430787 [Polyporus brumalis]
MYAALGRYLSPGRVSSGDGFLVLDCLRPFPFEPRERGIVVKMGVGWTLRCKSGRNSNCGCSYANPQSSSQASVVTRLQQRSFSISLLVQCVAAVEYTSYAFSMLATLPLDAIAKPRRFLLEAHGCRHGQTIISSTRESRIVSNQSSTPQKSRESCKYPV